VRDAVRAYHLAVTMDPKPGEFYNIGGEYTCAVSNVLHTLFSLSEAPLTEWNYYSDPARVRPVDADNQIPDCTKFREKTGWAPTIKFEHTMRDLLDYWRERVKVSAHLLR